MLDFKIIFRWGRWVYVGILAVIIGYFFSVWAGLICLLSVIDIRIDDNVWDKPEEKPPTNEAEPYGPRGSDNNG